MERARSTLADSRRVIDDLRAPSTDAFDLQTAVRQEVDRFVASTGIACDVSFDLPASAPDPIREHVLRFVSEGLTNIARHAEASEARVTMNVEMGELVVEVWDDGCGFEPETRIGQAGHYGLLGMRERARQMGGTLEIASGLGQGTRLALRLPLNAAPDADTAERTG